MKHLLFFVNPAGILLAALLTTGQAQQYYPPGSALPPRGYVLPAASGTPQRAPQGNYYPPAPARYPRPEPMAAPVARPRPAPVAQKRPAPEIVAKSEKSAKSTKAQKSTQAKVAVNDKTTTLKVVAKSKPAKSSAPLAKAKPENVIVKKEATAKPKEGLGELARDLHAPAKARPTPSTVAATAPAAQQPAPKTGVAPPTLTDQTVESPNPQGDTSIQVPTPSSSVAVFKRAEELPSKVLASKAMMPLALSVSKEASAQPNPDSEVAKLETSVTAPPAAKVFEDLPLSELPSTHELAATSKGEKAKPPISESTEDKPTEQPSTRHNSSEVTLPPIIRPSLASVAPASYRPSTAGAKLSTSVRPETSDFTPNQGKFEEVPETSRPPAPKSPLSSSLGTMTIDAERADSKPEINLFTFDGNVKINCKRFTMKADRVVANMRSAEQGQSGMEKVVGTGNVSVHMTAEGENPGYVASGGQATYDPIAETIHLSGWPKIEEGNKALMASSATTVIVIDTKTAKITTNGSTKTVLRQP